MWGVFEALISLGAVKSVQRGVAVSAGTITINAVNTNKAVVYSKSKGSAGYVAARGTVASHGMSGSISGFRYSGNNHVSQDNNGLSINFSGTAGSADISGGTTDLTVKEYSAKLVNSTQISCDGPVEWQVVEFR